MIYGRDLVAKSAPRSSIDVFERIDLKDMNVYVWCSFGRIAPSKFGGCLYGWVLRA